MPLTSLETISQKLTDVQSQRLEDILKISGSAAIAKNEYGVTVVDDTDVASTLLFKGLTKPKYDNEELVKAIDINVKELKPNIPTQNLNLVPKPLYEEQVGIVADLTNQVKKLSATVSDLNSQITTLQSQVQTETNNRLSIEQTNDALVNQINTLTNTISDFTGQISTSLQKSVDESILRASLQSQNTGFQAQIKALIKQIDSLNSIIEGLQSQLGAVQQQQAIQQGTQAQAMAAGADVINEVCIVKIKEKVEAAKPPVWAKIRASGGQKFVNGDYIDFTNNDKNPLTINITFTPIQNMAILGAEQTTFTLAASEQKQIKLTINEGPAGGRGGVSSHKNWIGWSGTADYKGGTMKIEVKKSDGTSKDKTYETGFAKTHPDSF
jgi:predicted  nucleic acid-binding Zn-ribbon protein